MTTPQAETEALLPTVGSHWLHRKSGGTYYVLAVGKIEADLIPAVVYQSTYDDKVWVRPLANFMDGRFEQTPDPRAALPPKPLSVAPEDEALITDLVLDHYSEEKQETLRRRIAELRARVAEERAERVLRGKMLVRLRNKLIHTTDTMVDEGGRVYFGSTNDADELRDRVQELDAFKWDLIMSEGALPDPLEQLRKANARAETAESALEAALKDADGWLPIALCPTDGVWRLVKLSDGNEAVAAFDGVGLLSKKRWQTKVFLTHRPACPSPINDLVTQPARDVFLIADLENGVYPTHFRPNDTVFGLPALNGAAFRRYCEQEHRSKSGYYKISFIGAAAPETPR